MPDLANVASGLGTFMPCATQEHWKAAKRVLWYLAGSVDRGREYRRGAPLVEVYTVSDYAGAPVSRVSTSGAVVLWRSRGLVQHTWGN